MEIYDAGYTNGYWIQRKTSGCATSIVPDYFVFTFSQLVLILTSLISFFIDIRILYRYREWKKGNEEMEETSWVLINDFEFLIDGKWS